MDPSYADIRAAIKAALTGVSGIGKLYDHQKDVSTEEGVKNIYTVGNRINALWFSLGTSKEDVQGGREALARQDESGEFETVEKSDIWEIVLVHSFYDDPVSPSEYVFTALVDKIEDELRFQQTLSNTVNAVYPLTRTVCGLATLCKTYVVHMAKWNLQTERAIIKI